MLVVVLWGALLVRGVVGSERRSLGSRKLVFGPPSELAEAFASVDLINQYNIQDAINPSVHLRELTRIAPDKYQDAIAEILQYFKEKRVVSVDLSHMDARQAARLIDFCSGMVAGNSGWLFRVSSLVIVLTPNDRLAMRTGMRTCGARGG